jgi:hypothetical protein
LTDEKSPISSVISLSFLNCLPVFTLWELPLGLLHSTAAEAQKTEQET